MTAVLPRTKRIGAALGAVLFACITAFAGWWFSPPEELEAWRQGPPPRKWSTWVRQDARWREEGIARQVEHRYVPLAQVSQELLAAVLVGEDIDFLGHGAVDSGAMWEAILQWWRGRRLRGASTISQQLAKTLFLSSERSLPRKLSEARLAWWLERSLGKRRILELYVNVVEFGPAVMGCEAAALRYFGIRAMALHADQAAALAAAIPSPGRDNPATASRRWSYRRSVILSRLDHVDWLRQRLRELVGHAQSTSERILDSQPERYSDTKPK